MIRSTIHTLVRKRLNEASADQWSDADVNTGVDVGYQHVENIILQSDPDAFIKVDRADLVNAQHEYAKPASLINALELSVLDSSTSKYDVIEKASYHDVRDRVASEDYQWAHYGRYFYLGPAPDAALTSGLQVKYVPALVLSLDTSVPQISQNYHMAIVLSAVIVLVGETADGVEKFITEREYLFGQLRMTYRRDVGHPSHIQIDQDGSMVKRY